MGLDTTFIRHKNASETNKLENSLLENGLGICSVVCLDNHYGAEFAVCCCVNLNSCS